MLWDHLPLYLQYQSKTFDRTGCYCSWVHIILKWEVYLIKAPTITESFLTLKPDTHDETFVWNFCVYHTLLYRRWSLYATSHYLLLFPAKIMYICIKPLSTWCLLKRTKLLFHCVWLSLHLQCIYCQKPLWSCQVRSPSIPSCGTLLRIYSTGTLLVAISMSLDGKSLSPIYLAKRPLSSVFPRECVYCVFDAINLLPTHWHWVCAFFVTQPKSCENETLSEIESSLMTKLL